MASCGGSDVKSMGVAFSAPAPRAAIAPAAAAPAEPGDENYCARYAAGEQPHRCAKPYCKYGGTWGRKKSWPIPPGKEWKQEPGEVFEQPPSAKLTALKRSSKPKRAAKKTVKPKTVKKSTRAKRPAKKTVKAKTSKRR
jgi:hypothetical protein